MLGEAAQVLCSSLYLNEYDLRFRTVSVELIQSQGRRRIMMASYQEGYDDERFEGPVPGNLHCNICLNVLRKPMQCVRNEHFFCKPCCLA